MGLGVIAISASFSTVGVVSILSKAAMKVVVVVPDDGVVPILSKAAFQKQQ